MMMEKQHEEWMSKWVNDSGEAQPDNCVETWYLADNQRALLGRGHGWLTLHIVMDNHGSHGFCLPIAQIQR